MRFILIIIYNIGHNLGKTNYHLFFGFIFLSLFVLIPSVMFRIIRIALLLLFVQPVFAQKGKPLRIGIAGLTHTHVHWLLGSAARGEVEIVGIAESNHDLAKRYLKQYKMDMALVYNSLPEMLQKTRPEAVAAFGSIEEHLAVVQTCAPAGVHVMVEKPLAVSLDHALQMKELAEKHKIHLLTNYETTWYATNHKTFELVTKDSTIGRIRKMVVHDGHEGPMEIGVNKEFLHWLTDPVANGGGALMDFGCYGANLVTWLMAGQRPESIMAITRQFKPHIYPKVDDDATILVQYPGMQAVIQASWNWPFSRKDMEVYGETGYVFSDNKADLRFRFKTDTIERRSALPSLAAPFDDPFAYLAGVVRGNIRIPAFDPSSLENNMIVMEILEAAKKSAREGRRVMLK